MTPTYDELWAEVKRLSADNERLLRWIRDLQDGGQVNCVYCGWNAGPRETTAPVLAEQLYRHVSQCEKHPMKGINDLLEEQTTANASLRARVEKLERVRDAALRVERETIFQTDDESGLGKTPPTYSAVLALSHALAACGEPTTEESQGGTDGSA